MVEAQEVAEQAREAALERIEVGERVVADAEKDVHGKVRSCQDVFERAGERAPVAAVVEDVLLHLVEDQVELRPGGDRALGKSVGERDIGRRAAAATATARIGSSRQLSTITTSAPSSSPPTAGTRVRSRRATPARRSELLPTPLGP